MVQDNMDLNKDPFGQQAMSQAVNITSRQLIGKFGALVPLSEMTLNEDPSDLDVPAIGKGLGRNVFMQINEPVARKIVDLKDELVTMLKAEGVINDKQNIELSDNDMMEIMDEWLENQD